MKNRRTHSLRWLSLAGVTGLILILQAGPVHSDPVPDGIPAKRATDYIYSIIKASREFYSQQIVNRLQKSIGLAASENWEQEKALPLPAQFLLLSAEESNARGIGLKVRLVSRNPINKKNGALTDLEKLGLQSMSKDTNAPFTWVVQRKGILNFRAIYPDLATSESCVNCHNTHPNSPKTDYKLGDIMGGVLINVPLSNVPLSEQGASTENDAFLVPPQVVADYIHAVLDSDRYVYTQHVVKPLTQTKAVKASENWLDEHALPLPAQYLLNTGRLAKKNRLKMNFRLISLWPINFKNSAANEFERNALVSVADDPLRPFLGKIKRGRSTYFQAVYPDFAVSQACVNCHNAHPNSPKTDFQLDDMIGGMLISFPLNK